MIKAFLLLLFAQWYNTTSAQSSIQAPSCYYSVNQTLDSIFYPCGDPSNGFKSCCEGGDNCLANNACYSPDYGTTYLAGCTDPDYQDSSCPNKPNLEDHSWVGLVTCDHVSTNWYACGDNAPTITHGIGCTCPQTSATLAFTAADSPIQAIMQLGVAYPQSSCFSSFSAYCSQTTATSPLSGTAQTAAPSSRASNTQSVLQTISTSLATDNAGEVYTVSTTFFVPNSMTTPVPVIPSNSSRPSTSSGSAATDSSSSSSTATSAGSGNQPSSNPSNTTGLQLQAKIGIGLGSAVGALCVSSLLWYCLACMKKRNKKKLGIQTGDQTEHLPSDDANRITENEKVGDDDPRSPMWSGHKSELPAEELKSPSRSAHKSELSAKDTELRSPVSAYEPYRGSYRSSRMAEAEGSPRFGGRGRANRDGLYEMP